MDLERKKVFKVGLGGMGDAVSYLTKGSFKIAQYYFLMKFLSIPWLFFGLIYLNKSNPENGLKVTNYLFNKSEKLILLETKNRLFL